MHLTQLWGSRSCVLGVVGGQHLQEERAICCRASQYPACLGLLGLASYTAEQRTKEIGVRKVLGASVGQIVKDLSQEFMMLVVAANVVGWPVAYRVDPGVGLYVGCGVATVLIAFLTVGYQSLRAAGTDPVTALRHE